MKFEVLVRPSSAGHTNYLIDDMKLEEIRPQVVTFDDTDNGFEKVNTNPPSAFSASFPSGQGILQLLYLMAAAIRSITLSVRLYLLAIVLE